MLQGLQSVICGRSASRSAPDTANNDTDLPSEPEHSGVHLLPNDGTTGNEAGTRTYEVDIVAVHGLNGTAIETWVGEKVDQKTHRVTKALWLKDFLYKDFPGARVFTYKYPSQLFFSKSKGTTDDYAQKLLLGLRGYRVGQERRPIIFIAHSLGGIVCKKALVLASEDSEFTTLLDSAIGILFFGTPHSGAVGTPDIAIKVGYVIDTLSKISGPRWFFGKVRKDLLAGLKPDSSDLRHITKRFSLLLRKRKLRIISIFETKEQPPLGQLIVEPISAIMGLSEEKSFARDTSHTELCRFADQLDPDYQIISREIMILCEESLRIPSLKASEEACIGVFRPFDLHKYKSVLSSQRVDGTCEWVLKNPQYQMWAHETQANLLWVSGHPASGKTILSSYISDSLEAEQLSTGENCIICFFSCIEKQRDDAKVILGSIIFQILVKRRYLIRHVERALEHDKAGIKLIQSFDSLWDLFTAIISDEQLGRISIIIDALDECSATSRNHLTKAIAKLLDRLRSSTSHLLRFLITSRPEFMIAKYFNSDDSYEPLYLPLDDAQDQINGDLRKVIHEGIRPIAKNTQAKQSDIDELEDFLNKNADQSFLWAKLNMELLDEELSTAARDFRSILAGVPRNMTETYRRLVGKIQPRWVDFARKLLQIIIASSRPLSLEEINILITTQGMTPEACHALARIEEQQLHTNIRMDIAKVLGSLVRISDSKVYLVHITLKKFLIEDLLSPALTGNPNAQHPERDDLELRRANLFLASACMAYLSLGCFTEDIYSKETSCNERVSLGSSQDGCQPGREEESQMSLQADKESADGYSYGHRQQWIEIVDGETRARVVQRYKLFEYAATFWAEHFAQGQELAGKRLRNLALRLSDDHYQHSHLNWLRFFWSTTWCWPGTAVFDQLGIAGVFGHYTLLKTLLKDAVFLNAESLATALYWASRNGHDQCVVSLLQTSVDPDACVVAAQSALCSAANIGHLSVVKALATDSRVNINFIGALGGTSLSHAAGSGHVEIVRLLLSQDDIDADVEDDFGDTPLLWAMLENQTEVVKILVADDRANLNQFDRSKTTPMSQAIREKNEEVVALLLQHPRFNADVPDIDGRTLLADAAMRGDVARIQQMHRAKKLNNAHSHNYKDGRTAISLAAEGGHNGIINFLLKCKGPGVDEEDTIKQWTPLFWAVEADRNSTIEILLKTPGVNVNHRDCDGRTALSWAVSHRNEEGIRLLLAANEIIPLIKDDEGRTPVDWARSLGESHIASLLEEANGREG